MDGTDVLIDGLGRVPGSVRRLVDGLDADQLAHQPADGANTIGWQVWHLTRSTDAQVADLASTEQLWISGGFAERLGFEPDPSDTGYGQTPEEAAAVRIEQVDLMLGYLDEVIARSIAHLRGGERLGPRSGRRPQLGPARHRRGALGSIVGDCLQHIGQANYVKGMLTGEPAHY